jgi:hypothetical protein
MTRKSVSPPGWTIIVANEDLGDIAFKDEVTNEDITSIEASKLTGKISNEQIQSIDASKMTGVIPAESMPQMSHTHTIQTQLLPNEQLSPGDWYILLTGTGFSIVHFDGTTQHQTGLTTHTIAQYP